jgi:succinate-semialdehyde dehydrogenase
MAGFRVNRAYVCNESERENVIAAIFEDGHTARDVVGQSAVKIARKAGFEVPENTKVLVVESNGRFGVDDPISKEKMCPVMAAFPYQYFEQAIEIAQTNLSYEGKGHTAGLHSNSQANIIKAGSELSVSRLIVNAICATTAGGSIQNGLPVTNTLGCGSWGGNSISENFTFKHLLNITRVAPIQTRMRVPSDEEIWN